MGGPVGRRRAIDNMNSPSGTSCWRKPQTLRGGTGGSMTQQMLRGGGGSLMTQQNRDYMSTCVHTCTYIQTCSDFHILMHTDILRHIQEYHSYLYVHRHTHMHTDILKPISTLTSTLAYNTYMCTLTHTV